jgi:hypothetical protein
MLNVFMFTRVSNLESYFEKQNHGNETSPPMQRCDGFQLVKQCRQLSTALAYAWTLEPVPLCRQWKDV